MDGIDDILGAPPPVDEGLSTGKSDLNNLLDKIPAAQDTSFNDALTELDNAPDWVVESDNLAEEDRTFGEFASDTSAAAAKSVNSLLRHGGQFLNWVYSATGYNNVIDAVAGEGSAESFHATNDRTFATGEQFFEDQKTEILRDRRHMRDMDLENAEGFMDSAAIMASSPSVLFDDLVGQSAELAATGAVGKLVGGASAAGRIGTAASFGGALEGGRARNESYNELSRVDPELWAQNEDVIAEMEREPSLTLEQAIKITSASYADKVGALAFSVVTATGAAPGTNVLTKALTGDAAKELVGTGFKELSKAVTGAALKGAAGEATQEVVSAGATDIAANIALGEADGETRAMDDVAKNAGMNAVAGAAMGGPLNAVSGLAGQAKENATVEDTDGNKNTSPDLNPVVNKEKSVADLLDEMDIEDAREVEQALPANDLDVETSISEFDNSLDEIVTLEELDTIYSELSDDSDVDETSLDSEVNFEEGVNYENNDGESVPDGIDASGNQVENSTGLQNDETIEREGDAEVGRSESEDSNVVSAVETSETAQNDVGSVPRTFDEVHTDGVINTGTRSYPADTTGSVNDVPPEGKTNERKDFDKRARVAAMSPEETFNALYKEEGTGISNGRAYAEDKVDAKEFTSIDVDSLASINDYGNHDMGDAMLAEVGKALQEEFGDQAYHKSGDEYFILDASDVTNRLEKVRAKLAEKVIEGDYNGNKLTVKGVDFTYGTDTDATQADAKMLESKKQRTERGERAERKSLPKNFTYSDADGNALTSTLTKDGRVEFAKAPAKTVQAKKPTNTTVKKANQKVVDSESKGRLQRERRAANKAKGAVNKVIGAIKERLNPTDMSKIPPELRAQYTNKNMNPQGTQNGTLFGSFNLLTHEIKADESVHKTVGDLRSTVYHEAIHSGLMMEFGDYKKVRQAMADLFNEIGAADVRRLKREFGMDLGGYNYSHKGNSPSDTLIIMEEILTHYGESRNGPLMRAGRKLEALIRKWLEEVGIPVPKGDVGRRRIIEMLNIAENGYTQRMGYKNFAQTGLRQTMSEAVMFSIESAQSKTTNLSDRAAAFARRNFTKERGLDKEGFDLYWQNEGQQRAAERWANFYRRTLEKAIKKQYRNASTEHYEQANNILQGKSSDISFNKDVMDAIADMRNSLDEKADAIVESMRDQIALIERGMDSKRYFDMLQALKDANNDVTKLDPDDTRVPMEIVALLYSIDKIKSNKGEYIHRSYEVFDNPDWIERVQKDYPEVFRRAVSYMMQGDKSLTYSAAKNKTLNMLSEMVERGESSAFISVGRQYGSRDMSIFKRRGDIPEPFRALMGEYRDIRANYAATALKIDTNLANHRFLHGMYNHLEATGRLFAKPEDAPDGVALVPMTSKKLKSYSPLSKMWTTPEMREALRSIVEVTENPAWLDAWLKINAVVKYNKTVSSFETQIINFVSGISQALANGHLFDIMLGDGGVKTSAKTAFNELMNSSSKAQLASITEMLELGVFGESATAREIQDAMKPFRGKKMHNTSWVRNKTGEAIDFMQRSYAMGDDFWKMLGFTAEVARLKKQKKKDGSPRFTSDRELKLEAARQIRDGYATYSMVPNAVQSLGKFPAMATFTSFPWEVMRTSRNHVLMVKRDIDNNDMSSAIKRATGFAVAHSMFAMAAITSMANVGFDEEDDENFKAMQSADFVRNSTYYYTGFDENGQPQYLDMTRYNFYAYINEPIVSLFNGSFEDMPERVKFGLHRFVDPYISPEIAVSAVSEIHSNTTSFGTPIWDETASSGDKAIAAGKHFWKAVRNTTLGRAQDAYEASDGSKVRGGQQVTVVEEVLAALGFRLRTANMEKTFGNTVYSLAQAKREMPTVLSKVAGAVGEVTDEELSEAVDDFMERRTRVYTKLIGSAVAAEKLGLTQQEIRELIDRNGGSADDANNIVRGRIPKWEMSDRFLDTQLQNLIDIAQTEEEKDEIRKTVPKRKARLRELLREWEAANK